MPLNNEGENGPEEPPEYPPGPFEGLEHPIHWMTELTAPEIWGEDLATPFHSLLGEFEEPALDELREDDEDDD